MNETELPFDCRSHDSDCLDLDARRRCLMFTAHSAPGAPMKGTNMTPPAYDVMDPPMAGNGEISANRASAATCESTELVGNQSLLRLLTELVIGESARAELEVVRLWRSETEEFWTQQHAPNTRMPPDLPKDLELPLDDAVTGWVWKHQRPLLMAAETETRFVDFATQLLECGIKYFCAVPLTLANRRIGVLGLASKSPDSLSSFELDYMRRGSGSIGELGKWAQPAKCSGESKTCSEDELRCPIEEFSSGDSFQGIVGRSAPMRCLRKQIKVVAPTNSTVLILGETGTGKELIGQALHDLSLRSNGPFVKVNCAAIPAGLIESELFGHERGAFTGALGRRIGRFEMANGGTLLLDEIGDIPLELQPKLLRVLQEQQFERVGGAQTNKVNVRIVAATSRDLPQMVAAREFRADLYYRLNVFPLRVPALRERAEDIPLLVQHFVELNAKRMEKSITEVPAEILQAFSHYSWPGNVRELQNAIERAVILSPGNVLRLPAAELRHSFSEPEAAANGLGDRMTLKDAEREHILQALAATNWVLGGPKGAGARLGLARTSLISKMRRLGITRAQA